ncbi:MAG: glycosyltransferase family 2 protein [Patescibacteria group bacterium]|nr:glycosyltransferase family 2 protein [Patescibacteria group bacterium]
MEQERIFISVVVPIYNEEGAVKELYNNIITALNVINKPYEVIFVNDGSTDSTFKILTELCPLKIINFRRNFGQTAAMDAGIKKSMGKYIATLDGDGQNDPADIARLLEKLENDNFDLVCGWRKKRKDTFFKKFFSRCAAQLRKKMINDGIHDSGCTLKVYKKECFRHIDLVGEMHRFIPGILKIKGFRIGELEVNHFERISGKTKYNIWRGPKGALDMFSVWFWRKYSSRPLHLFGSIGLLIILISGAAGLLALYRKIFTGMDLSDTAMTQLSMFGFFTGVQFLVFGLLADILSKTYFSSTKDEIYTIKEIIENK